MYQKVTRMGMEVNMAKKNVVNSPPPTFRARRYGIERPREIRRTLEKLSLLAASAGRGAFLMAGY